MSNQPSLAEFAVETLATVLKMDDDVTNDHPERHQIRAMKRIANQAIEQGLRTAWDLAAQARDLQRTMRQIEAENEAGSAA